MTGMTLTEFVTTRLDEEAAAARDLIESEAASAEWHELSSGVLVTGAPTHDDTWQGTWPMGDSRLTRFIASRDPARVLRDVAAKRKILDTHAPGYPVTYPEPSGQPTCGVCHAGGFDWEPEQWPCPTVRALASTWSDHPDYDPAWRPS